MKSKQMRKFACGLVMLFSIFTLSGCAPRERTVTYEETEVCDGMVESKSMHMYKAPNKRIEKQVVREKTKCVGKNGKLIKANTVKECLKQGGKIVDEVSVEEVMPR